MKALLNRKKSIYRMSDKNYMQACLTGVGLTALLAYIFYHSVKALLFLSPVVLLIIRLRERDMEKKIRFILNLQFRDCILSMASAMSAGYSLENALEEAYGEMILLHGKESIIAKEMETMSRQLKLSVPVEKAFSDFAERTGLEDIRIFTSVMQIAKRGGGDFNRIIRSSADTISEKLETQKEIQTLLGAKKLEQTLMNLIPLLIIVYINQTSPDLLRPMYETILGTIVMTLCLGGYALAWLISKKIVELEV
ncbi:type II secretion system F family protein [Parasporobacterium paucivorans]|uniref:Tight adherence protein B n=1 Tax=Parasporobacterium paucivorans DSM 15970 TaxID=1122934 RepID=A0A1M6JAW0_9FIRM|nr:type II secretion system F family protein [Parasporobacterium paucivorans]SHJ43772.1 tight adherence protein B [Parasporobacterium paucivorans DSM 15970]